MVKETKFERAIRLQAEKEIMAKVAIENQGKELKVGTIIMQTLTSDKFEIVALNVKSKSDAQSYSLGEEYSDSYCKTKFIEKGGKSRILIGSTCYYPISGKESGSFKVL